MGANDGSRFGVVRIGKSRLEKRRHGPGVRIHFGSAESPSTGESGSWLEWKNPHLRPHDLHVSQVRASVSVK